MEQAAVLAVLVALSLFPPLAFAFWVRNRERHGREPVRAILQAFAFGATIGVAVAFVLNTAFDTATATFSADAGITPGILTAVLAAPFIEEVAKGLGLPTQRRRIMEWEDGMVYGAAIGLGFAASENLLYGLTVFFQDGFTGAVGTLIMRILSSMILHAGTAAMLGYGYGRVILGGTSPVGLLPFYILAVALHMTYNLLVTLQTLVGLVTAILLVWAVIGSVRRRIESLDELGDVT